MMVQKSEFIRSLQDIPQPLSPYDISQRVRREIGCVALYQGDQELSTDEFRGYMVKYKDRPDRTPEDPELYICAISMQQSREWQNLVWIKEILQILDPVGHRTNNAQSLGEMLSSRKTTTPNGEDTPLNVVADKLGFILALGAAVPRAYRNIVREGSFITRFPDEELEKLIGIPHEFIEFVLDESFEAKFDDALVQCD